MIPRIKVTVSATSRTTLSDMRTRLNALTQTGVLDKPVDGVTVRAVDGRFEAVYDIRYRSEAAMNTAWTEFIKEQSTPGLRGRISRHLCANQEPIPFSCRDARTQYQEVTF